MQLTFPAHIFRAYDIRGKTSDLTPNMVNAIGHAFADHLVKLSIQNIVLGYDARLSSPQYAYIIQRALERQNINVIGLGCCSTPMMYFHAHQYDGHGIMVTASHNAKTDNGIKWLIGPLPPTPQDIQYIGKMAQTYLEIGNYPTIQPAFLTQYARLYCDDLVKNIDLKYPLKVVVDAMSGSAGQYVVPVLERLGCKVIALNCTADGNFPRYAPDPSNAEHVRSLRCTVLKHEADLGLALDGDVDRIVLADEEGTIISPDQLLCFFAEQLLKEHPNQAIVYDVKCSSLVKKNILKSGGQPVMLRTGSTFLRRYLSEHENAVFGGEYAGHYVFNDGRGRGYDDGLYAGLRILGYFTHSKAHCLSELFKNYMQCVATPDIYIPVCSADIPDILSVLKNSSTSAVITDIDGIRFDYDEGFGIVRASNTGEYLTLRFDAKDIGSLKQIQHQILSFLQPNYPQLTKQMSQYL